MKKAIGIFFVACSVAAAVVACGPSKSNSIRKENTSTIMDSGAQSKPPAIADTSKQQ